MALQLIDRFHPRLRIRQQAAISTGHVDKREEMELLDPQRMRSLALLGLVMFVIGCIGFGILNVVAYLWRVQIHSTFPSGWTILLWLATNVIACLIVVPVLHEGVHSLVISLLGGSPYYGARLPFALYCSARNQLFRRNHYLAVALAPLIVISLAGCIFILVAPVLASYVFFGTVGNFSGACGDLYVAARILRQPASVLVEDTETGFRVWELCSSLPIPECETKDH